MPVKHVTEQALAMLRSLPRVSLANIRDNPGSKKNSKRGRGQHGGDKHGDGDKGRNNYMRVGYECKRDPFYLLFPREKYYHGHHLRREYPPIPLSMIQKLVDTNRVDPTKPIDLVALMKTGLFFLHPDQRHAGFNLTDEGADYFNAKINIEIQWASENSIAAIERNGGVITTAYYDMHSLQAMINTQKFLEKGVPIPKRMVPPPDAIEYYSDPTKRGYLADPEKISEERLILAQKFGYVLPEIEKDPDYDMLTVRKDPRQIFYGLHPGWVINLKDKTILKPKDEELLQYYAS